MNIEEKKDDLEVFINDVFREYCVKPFWESHGEVLGALDYVKMHDHTLYEKKLRTWKRMLRWKQYLNNKRLQLEAEERKRYSDLKFELPPEYNV